MSTQAGCKWACLLVALLALCGRACCQSLHSIKLLRQQGEVQPGSLQSVQHHDSREGALALQNLGASANCSSTDWVCPGCQAVNFALMSSVASRSCRPAPGSPSTQLLQCGSEQVSEELVSSIQQDLCHPACSWRASQYCSQHRALLQATNAPENSVASPSAPVSNASPFEGLALGPIPEYPPGSDPSTSKWLCANTLLSVDTFHGLRIAIQDDVCANQTARFGIYICDNVVVDASTFDAVQSGKCTLTCGSAATACSTAPSPSPSSASSPSSKLELPTLVKAPALAPDPSSCPGANYVCGDKGQFQASAGLYATAQAASGCTGPPGSATCAVGGYLIDRSLYTAIKGGSCKQNCGTGAPIACAQAPALALAPALLNPLAAAAGLAYPPCGGQSYTCGNQTLAASLYKDIASTSTCQGSLDGFCLTGGNFVDAGLFATVKAGSCRASCATDRSPAPCSATAAPGKQCAQPGYTCNSQRISAQLFQAINGTSKCSTATAGFCVAGDSVVDPELFKLVASGLCIPACLELPPAACSESLAPGAQPPATAPTPGCSPARFACGAQKNILVPAKLFYAASAAADCIAFSETTCTAAGSILEKSSWAAIKGGTCEPICDARAQLPCPAAAPEASCSHPEVVCSGNDTFHMQPELYTALLGLSSCSGGICIAGSFIVEEPLWEAVQFGRCSQSCLDESKSCTVAVPALAPESSVELASSILQFRGFVLDFGEWDTCDMKCSNITQQRPLTCRSMETNLPVELTNCNYTLSDLEALSRPCGEAACSPFSWQTDSWGECSESCGVGTATRNATCFHNGRAVPDDTPGCQSTPMPALEGACYLEPCVAVSWKAGPWGACQAGVQTRTVSCVEASSAPAQAEDCSNQLGYTAPTTRPCNAFACKSAADCSNNGICNLDTSSCECSSGYAGTSCNIFKGPCNATATPDAPAPAPAVLTPSSSNPQYCCATGIVDFKGRCCKSGLVGGSGSCCSMNSQLDLYGECCPGPLDACGQCGGVGKAVDFLGTCCSGSLDAGGICCPTPLSVDEFGVCDGKSTTGILALSMIANGQDVGMSATALQEFNTSYTGLLAYTFDVNRSQVVLQDIQEPVAVQGRRPGQLSPTSGRGLTSTQATGSGRSLLAQLTVNTEAWLYPPYGSLSYPEALSLLAANSPLIATTGGRVQLGSVQQASKRGLAGNMVCEVGELPGAAGAGEGDPSDCQLALKAVPRGRNDTACSGRGRAIYAQGACECWVGYQGDACEACTPGYQFVDGICLRTFNSFQGYTIVEAPPSPGVAGASLALPLSLAVAGIVTVFAVASLFVARRKRQRLVASHCERVDSSNVWAFTDPDGSLRSSSQGRPAHQSGSARRGLAPALNSRPLAHLLGWLADNGFSADQVQVHQQRHSPSTSGSSHKSFAPASAARGLFSLHTSEHREDVDLEAAPRRHASLRGLFNLHTLEHSQDGEEVPDALAGTESPRAKRARALVYTADLSDAGSDGCSRQRHITWSQDAEGAQEVLNDSPTDYRSRRTFTYSLEQAGEHGSTAARTNNQKALDVDQSMNSFSSSVSAIPAAPQFRPIPAFVPASEHALHSGSSSLATPNLYLVETAPTPSCKPAGGRRAAKAATAFWPKLPWETGASQASKDTADSQRWVP